MQAQVQVYRQVIRALESSLADFGYLLMISNIDNASAVAAVQACEKAMRCILTTFDGNTKLKHMKSFCSEEFPVIEKILTSSDFLEVKKIVGTLTPELATKIQGDVNFYRDMVECLEKMTASLDSANGTADPFDTEQIVNMARESALDITETEIIPLQTKVTDHYNMLFTLASQIRAAAAYTAKFLSGEPPSEPDGFVYKKLAVPCVKRPRQTLAQGKRRTSTSGQTPSLGPVRISGNLLIKEGQNNDNGKNKLFLDGLKIGKNKEVVKQRKREEESSSSSSGGEINDLLSLYEDSLEDKGSRKSVLKQLLKRGVLRQKEVMALKENIAMVLLQKQEMMNLYEDYIKELLKQNEFLKKELEKKKKEATSTISE